MDRGAHFYSTDFQIHSPRDHQWSGTRSVSPEDRLAYARSFVRNCREKAIQAVAITDHHDVYFIKYFQLAAQEHHTDSPVPCPNEQNPIVFPGVELTLQVPCQVLVILDADADETLQVTLLHAIGITPHLEQHERGPDVRALPFHTLNELDDRLNSRSELRGRYIILPNVGSSGHKTLLRNDFHEKYARMPCVGGYIEQDWSEHNRKYILEGKVREWGWKALGVFQTSDSRREDCRDLGCRCTWVKIAEPTAEGLRQACLARESHISHVQPTIPTRYISRLEVSNSTFMGHVDFELNPQFNALIGGRGTGKSTLLEYLRWAMQDQPVSTDSDIELTDGVAHKRRLIQDTLVKIGGIVTVHWNVDGIPHLLRCNSATNELTLKVGGEDAAPVTGDYLRGLLPIRAYSQKQLSSVSIRTAELQRFIEQPIQEELEKVEAQIRQLRDELKTLYADILRLRSLERELLACRTTLSSVSERVVALEKSLPKLTDKAQKALAEHAFRLREQQAVEALQKDLESVAETLAEAEQSLSTLPQDLDIDENSTQKDLLNKLHARAAKLISETADGLKKLRSNLVDGRDELLEDLKQWAANHEIHQKAYDAAQEEASAHKKKMSQIRELRNQEAETRKRITNLDQQLKASPDPEMKFNNMWDSWCQLHQTRGDLLQQQCESLSEKSGGDIRAELVRGADIDATMEKLDVCLKGSRISQEKWNALRSYLLEAGPVVEKWRELMLELRRLAETEIEDLPSGRPPEPLESWDLTENQLRCIVERLKPESWLEVALTSLKDLPRFFYSGGRAEIPFEQASAGQQATALLKVLLHESGGPLIIDQPEEDLDNAVIDQIVTELWKAKQNRQIIVASHNANLVVNGDAELVIHCDYSQDDERSKGEVKHLGAIDVREIREAITNVMEGGRRAFELRKQKYGF